MHADAPILIHALRPIDRMKVCQHLSAFIANTDPVAAKTRTSKVLRLDSNAGLPRTPAYAHPSVSDDVSTPSTQQHHQAEWGNTIRTLALTSQRKPQSHPPLSSRQFHSTRETSSSDLLRATSTRYVLPACSSVLNVRMLRWPCRFRPGTFCYLAGDISNATGFERSGSEGSNAGPALHTDRGSDSRQQTLVADVVPLLVRVINTVTPHQAIDRDSFDADHLLHYHVEFFGQTGGRQSGHYCRTARRAIVAGAELLPLRDQLNFDADLSTWSNVKERAPLLLLPTAARVGDPAAKKTQSPTSAGKTPIVGWKEEFETMSGRIVAANSDLDIFVSMTAHIVAPQMSCKTINLMPDSSDTNIDCGLLALLKAFGGDHGRVHAALQRALTSLIHRPVQFYFAAESGLSQDLKGTHRGNVELCFVVHFAAHTYGPKSSVIAKHDSARIEAIANSLCCELAELYAAPGAGDVFATELGGGVDVLDMQGS